MNIFEIADGSDSYLLQCIINERLQSLLKGARTGSPRPFALYHLTHHTHTMSSSPRPCFTGLPPPPEVLYIIFQLAKGDTTESRIDPFTDEYAPQGLDTIKSLRLTCRFICGIASELLLDGLDVQLSISSLSHLNQVIQNPAIAKGIRAVRLNLDGFFPALADERLFLVYVYMVLAYEQTNYFGEYQEYIGRMMDTDWEGRDRLWESDFESRGFTVNPPLTDETWIRVNTDFLFLQKACLNLIMDGADCLATASPRMLAVANAVARSHMEIRRLLQSQQYVLENDTLVQTLADAMAKMPRVRMLWITDDQEYLGKSTLPWPTLLDDVDRLFLQLLTRPCDWATWKQVHQELRQRDPPFPTHLVYALLLAISRKASCPLLDLDIRLTFGADQGWNLTKEGIFGLRQAACTITSFMYTGQLGSKKQEGAFVAFLEAIIGGSRLEFFLLDFNQRRLDSRPMYSPDISHYLALLSSRALEEVDVTGDFLSLDNVKALTAKPRGHFKKLGLKVHMVSGTATEAKKLLRNLATRVTIENLGQQVADDVFEDEASDDEASDDEASEDEASESEDEA